MDKRVDPSPESTNMVPGMPGGASGPGGLGGPGAPGGTASRRAMPVAREDGQTSVEEVAGRESTSSEGPSTGDADSESKQGSATSSIIGAVVGGGAALLTAFSILVALGWVAWMVVSDHAGAVQRAVSWVEVDGVITRSAVDPGTSRGSARGVPAFGRKARIFLHRSRPDVAAEYQVSGTTFETTSLGGYGQPFVWRPPPVRLAAQMPVGSAVRVLVDPADPRRGVIGTGVAGWRLLELLIVIPFVALAALGVRAWLVRRALRRDPLGQRLRIGDAGSMRLRMTSSSAWSWALIWTAIGAPMAIVATLAAVGREPSVADVALAATTAIALGALAGACRAWTLGQGRHDLVVDDVRNVLVLPSALRRPREATPGARSGAGSSEARPGEDVRMRTLLDDRRPAETIACARIEAIEAVEPAEGSGWLLRITPRGSRPGGDASSSPTPIELPTDASGALWVPAAAEWLREQVLARGGARRGG